METKKDLDWEAIEADFRAGLKSIRAIADEYGTSDAAIRKRAKKLGWARDLSHRISVSAEAIIQREATQFDDEQDIVDANARLVSQVGLNHRLLADRLREKGIKLLQELDSCDESLLVQTRIYQMLANSLGSVIERERQVFGMDKQVDLVGDERNKIQIEFVKPPKRDEKGVE